MYIYISNIQCFVEAFYTTALILKKRIYYFGKKDIKEKEDLKYNGFSTAYLPLLLFLVAYSGSSSVGQLLKKYN